MIDLSKPLVFETVYDYMPKLKPYKPGMSIDIKNFNLTHIATTGGPGKIGHTYANDHYSFAWWEPDPGDERISIYNNDVRNLFRPRSISAWKLGHSGVSYFNDKPYPYQLEIVPPKTRLKDGDLFESFETERLMICKTLLDLDAIIREKHGMWVLNDDLVAAFKNRLSTIL